ncbi:putative GTP-binding protein 6 isoform X2 [Dysidea avara]|uniref:putative GTP-binding protein 6 isoform X2 n=1 Tax=Dysidea avara TaxID=196820 RepID=UPI00331D34C8
MLVGLRLNNHLQILRRPLVLARTILRRTYANNNRLEDSLEESGVFIIHPDFRNIPKRIRVPSELAIGEARGLVEAISSWHVMGEHIESLRRPHSKYLFGEAKLSELTCISPLQQHEFEKKFGATVYDRFMVILKIFQERARTNEAKLQVELAEIPYLKARLNDENLVHTSASQLRGTGETPLQVQRRVLMERETKLKQQLQHIKDKRKVTRVNRKKKEIPVVAAVGYTNAGKTTLIKQLTKEQSMQPKDQLFATLDSTIHTGKLPCNMKVLFLDTIGFISDLPHELVESFSTTLEDVLLADVLIHVRDVSHPLTDLHKQDVIKVLTGLNPSPSLIENMLEVHNKIDLVDTLTAEDTILPSKVPPTNEISSPSTNETDGIPISATQGSGIDALWNEIEETVLKATGRQHIKFNVPSDGPQLGWLHQNSTVTAVETTNENTLQVTTVISQTSLAKYKAKFHTKQNT